MPSLKKARSAGLLMYRFRQGNLEVLLAHPGGPYFASKSNGHWTIPKGEIEAGEAELATALREFKEEVGIAVDPGSQFHDLGTIRQQGGKVVQAWAVEGDYDPSRPIPASTFEMEWPPRSGQRQRFPEVDKLEFFALAEARVKLKATQLPFLQRLEAVISCPKNPPQTHPPAPAPAARRRPGDQGEPGNRPDPLPS